MQEVNLDSATFEFSQQGNCLDKDEYESITIECKADIGIDNLGNCFYVIRTKQWSFDSLEELQRLIDRISKAINK